MGHIKPNFLFVKLCNQRLNLLTDDGPNSPPPPTPPPPTTTDHNATEHTDQDALSVRQMYQAALRSNPNLSRSAALSSVLLTKVQGDYATKLGVNIGQEFKEAYKVARLQHHTFQEVHRRLQWERMYGIHNNNNNIIEGINGCTVVLGDRPVQVRNILFCAFTSISPNFLPFFL